MGLHTACVRVSSFSARLISYAAPPALSSSLLALGPKLFFFSSGGVTERTREAASHQNPASRRTERRTKEGQGRKRQAQMPRQKSGVLFFLAQAADQTRLRPPPRHDAAC